MGIIHLSLDKVLLLIYNFGMDEKANKLINDIMAEKYSCVMLISEAGTGKTNILTELSSRYKVVFWFDALNLNMSTFSNYLIDVIVDNKEKSDKLNQFIYCKSEYNGDSVIIAAILDYIAGIRHDCLMVFERMEDIVKDFDLSLIERLIKHCPPNLKIVISSDKYIDLDYTRFEPKFPKIIDESDLDRQPVTVFSDYLGGLSKDELAFLIYISKLKTFSADFAESFYPKAKDLLKYLSCKDYYIVNRADSYRFSRLFKEYLKSIKNDYSDIIEDNYKENILKLYADYLKDKGNYLEAFECYYFMKDYDMLDNCVEIALSSPKYLQRGTDIALNNRHYHLEERRDKLFYSLFYCLYLEGRKEYDKALELYEQLAEEFRAKGIYHAEIICLKRHYGICVIKNNDELKLKQDIINAVTNYKDVSPEYLSMLFNSIIEYRKELNKTLFDLEKDLLINYSKNAMYVKNMEFLAYTYFDSGNYKRALEIAFKLKDYLPHYVIPHNFLAFLYYTGEISKTEKLASDALKFALDNEITKDISLLYSALGMIDLYYDLVPEAIEKYDKACRMNDGDFAKFYNIGLRCITYAKYRDANYAKEIAQIYLKYCEKFKPEYKNVMQIALAFAYLKLDDMERAYDYATNCVQNSKSRTTNWFLGMAIATKFMLDKDDLKDAITLIARLFKSSSDCGLDMIIVDYYDDVFKSLISFSKRNNIELEYIAKVEELVKNKGGEKRNQKKIRINMFGQVNIFAGDTLIKWKTKKSKELFLHYIMAGEKGLDRNIIINYMWKDYLYASAINNLKTTNNSIRATLQENDIKFKLDYINSKYVLHIDSMDSDYLDYTKLRDEYHEDMPLTSRTRIMNSMLKLYKDDFAVDILYPDFMDERKIIKQELIISLIKLVRYLAKQGDYLEAKRFLTSLESIDKNSNYQNMFSELDTHLNIIK